RPETVDGVTHADVSYNSPYGKIAVKWEKANGRFDLSAEIPVNTTATIYLPVSGVADITESGKPVKGRKDIKVSGDQNEMVLIPVGSGQYRFRVNTKK
ncbi:MAG TPA: alpha-L-rhamnosidase C-terminal domain-containing protein, partial [Agriterribacter sp.]|nr:alpha-L-rhamnosidase C-terminal domain-containing protein [Agriterribacter sp.]